MSEKIDCSVSVAKITDTQTDERVITIVLKGQKTIVHDLNGYDLEDIAEIELKVKCKMVETAKRLGIAAFLDTKIVSMRDRDESLQSFGEMEPVPAAQQSIS